MVKGAFFAYVTLFLLVLAGCGSGNATVVPLPIVESKAIVLTAGLKPGSTYSTIKAIEVSFVLPATASPVLDPNKNDGSLLIGETGLKNLKITASQGYIPSGSFDPVTRTVHFMLLPNDISTSDIGTGDFARITYSTSSGAELTAQEVQQSLEFLVSGSGSADISALFEPTARPVKY